MARWTLLVCLFSAAVVACDCDGGAEDPCQPNPCIEAHKTVCSLDGQGRAVCACEPGYLPQADGSCLDPWLQLSGGRFSMGSPEGVGVPAEHPQHEVTVPSFELYRAEVTVAQYRLCVEASACTQPASVSRCNYETADREDHPINCVNHQQAGQYCAWAGGRLPSEAEWEYAARGTAARTYPWGEEAPDCTRCVMNDADGGGDGCGENHTAPVCSKPSGHTPEGFCDLAGNVYEWVEDVFHDSYEGAPADGSAWLEPAGDMRVRKGGAYDSPADTLRSAYRNSMLFNLPASSSGVRCAR